MSPPIRSRRLTMSAGLIRWLCRSSNTSRGVPSITYVAALKPRIVGLLQAFYMNTDRLSRPVSLDCRTVSHQATPVAYSLAMAQNPAAALPVPSDRSILHSMSSFVSESPASVSKLLFSLIQNGSRGPIAEQLNLLQSILQESSISWQELISSRYRQTKEQRFRRDLHLSEMLYEAGYANTLHTILDLSQILFDQRRY